MIKASLLSRALLVVIVFFTPVVVPAVPINSQMATTDNISNATSTTNDTNVSSEAITTTTTTITKPSLSTVLTKPPPSLEK
jgi:hypothetical protein